jgi:hypothetical protein
LRHLRRWGRADQQAKGLSKWERTEMNLRSIQIRVGILIVALSLGLLAAVGRAAQKAPALPAANEEFFIVSSVNLQKDQIVLKRPTEVTQLVAVNNKTVILNEEGKTIQLKNLRAGDTVYVSFAPGTEQPLLATRIRKAPMTVEELHRRYVPFQ